MELRGDALRADLRRICSLASVMPPLPGPGPEKPPAKLSDAAMIKRRQACKAGEQRRQQTAINARPPGVMSKPEVAVVTGLNIKTVETKVRRLGIQPVCRNVFAWYAIEDLQRAGILPQVG